MLIKIKCGESHLPNREIQSFKIFLDSTRRYAFLNHNVISLRLESNQNLHADLLYFFATVSTNLGSSSNDGSWFGPFVGNGGC